MQFKPLLKFMGMLLIGATVIAMVSCGGNETATEEEATAEVEEVTPPPPPPPPPSAKKRSDVSARAAAKANETPEEFNAVDETEVETIDGVEFLPHRFSYEDPADDQPLVVSMTAFDTPPIFGNKCHTDDTPDDCSHDAIQSYVSNRIEYPDEAENFDNMVEYVTFTVQADGSVDGSNIQILPQDPQCHTCAAEALEIIRDMPKWKPAEKDGQPVPAKVTVPIRFATE